MHTFLFIRCFLFHTGEIDISFLLLFLLHFPSSFFLPHTGIYFPSFLFSCLSFPETIFSFHICYVMYDDKEKACRHEAWGSEPPPPLSPWMTYREKERHEIASLQEMPCHSYMLHAWRACRSCRAGMHTAGAESAWDTSLSFLLPPHFHFSPPFIIAEGHHTYHSIHDICSHTHFPLFLPFLPSHSHIHTRHTGMEQAETDTQ